MSPMPQPIVIESHLRRERERDSNNQRHAGDRYRRVDMRRGEIFTAILLNLS